MIRARVGNVAFALLPFLDRLVECLDYGRCRAMEGEGVVTYWLRTYSLAQARILGNTSGDLTDAIATVRLGQQPSAEGTWFDIDRLRRGTPHC